MIRVFTDKNLIHVNTKEPLFPLFDEFLLNNNTPLKDLYVFVNKVANCDLIILPICIDYLLEKKNKKLVDYYFKLSLKYNKPLWVFSSGDLGLTIKKSNTYVFRLADFDYKKLKNSIIIPPFINDPIITHKIKAEYLEKTTMPSIGYVGYANDTFLNYIKTIIIYFKYNFEVFIGKIHSDYYKLFFASSVRIKILNKINEFKSVKTNFIFRKKYRAGVKTEKERIKTTIEFFENIKKNQYTFCIRGGGNFSIRLYETLAMGRIPIQINTNCVLPLQNEIEWEKHCIIVYEKEISKLEDKLLKFHSKFSNEEFIELQKSNRKFWEENLTRVGYFKKIHEMFINNML